jgi:hypothetical protein
MTYVQALDLDPWYKVVTLLVLRFKYLMVEEPARKHSLQGIEHHV